MLFSDDLSQSQQLWDSMIESNNQSLQQDMLQANMEMNSWMISDAQMHAADQARHFYDQAQYRRRY